jgi:integrase
MTDKMGRRRARRKRRFGYVFERKWPSGRTNFCAQWFDQTQGNKRLTRHFDKEKEANDFLDELERQVLAKVYVTPPTVAETMKLDPIEQPPAVPTFVEYAQGLLDKRLKATLAPNTMHVYRANLLALSGFYGERDDRPATRLDEVTAASFLDYRAFRRTTNHHPGGKGVVVSAATINRDQQFLCRVLNEAVIDQHVAANPIAGLTKLKEPRKPRRFLTKEEIALVVEHAPRWFRPLVVAAIYTGARRCELTALRWNDIDFKGGKITLFRQKVGNADLIDLHPVVAEELKALRARREKRKTVEDSHYIFLSRRGGRFTDISRSWELTLAGAGLTGRDGITFHSLRHSHATHFLEGGGAVSDLQAQLGHANLATTQRYAAAINERRRATVLAMDFRPKGKVSEQTKRTA